jgi:diguanylate cyclase
LDHYGLTSENLQQILAQVNQALINHNHWYLSLIRSVTCKLPIDACELSHDSHLKCELGKWYYSNDNLIPRTHPKFSAIELKHKIMHQAAKELLLASQQNTTIDILVYDNFSNALNGLLFELNEFKIEIENLLYMYDSLTGASARTGILPTLKTQQELVKRGVQSQGCIAMMDLDFFKRVNDTYGHQAGDHVLSSVIRYTTEQLRQYDTVFRYGGEEFLIFLPHTDLNDGRDLIDRIRTGIESLAIKIEEDTVIHVTASFGLVTLDIDTPVEVSIKRADKAMYRAKASGRNCVKIDGSLSNNNLKRA